MKVFKNKRIRYHALRVDSCTVGKLQAIRDRGTKSEPQYSTLVKSKCHNI